MKKIAVIVQQKETDSTITGLSKLGAIHIEHVQAPTGEDINAIKDNLSLINDVNAILSSPEFASESVPVGQKPLTDWKFIAKHVIDLYKRLDQLKEYAATLKNRISEWERWGDFAPEAIQDLAGKNVYVKLFQIPQKELKNLPLGLIVKQIFSSAGLAHCVIISKENIALHFKEINLPKLGLKKMQERLSEDERATQKIRQEIQNHLVYLPGLLAIKKELEKKLELREAARGMAQAGELSYLTGYIPFDLLNVMEEKARKEKWGILISEPARDDNVPTLLRNPRWVSLIKPVLKLLEIVPGYKELDISLVFLLFFAAFFGILIGDAGYGAVYLALTFFAQKKLSKKIKDRSAFLLFYGLSFCAMIWGSLTGNFFGPELLETIGIKPFVPALNEPKVMQAFCFFLGATHLSIGHGWRAILKLPSLAALADIGWICVLWSAFFFAKMLILGDTLPDFVKWVLFAGMALVVLFTNPQKNMLKGIGEGLGTLALSLMNNFTDVVSYVRLFAVGLAGVAIAQTTNIMARGLGDGIIMGLAGILIFIIGHSLNIVLGPISVLVHGVRLNVLEFSGHAGITWSGVAYKPLKG
ncbi:MAG: hypothetical protein AB1481_04705 [Candidatus Omnitrophota bacterium]